MYLYSKYTIQETLFHPFPFPWAKLGYNGEKWLKHEKGEN